MACGGVGVGRLGARGHCPEHMIRVVLSCIIISVSCFRNGTSVIQWHFQCHCRETAGKQLLVQQLQVWALWYWLSGMVT
jgi:hypothetical protein